MKMEKTLRGFSVIEFIDQRDNECSLQKSSMAAEDCIWLGCNEIGLKHFIPSIGWRDVKLIDGPPRGECYIANTRMHLTQEQVKMLLPYLQRFVETGELSEGEKNV